MFCRRACGCSGNWRRWIQTRHGLVLVVIFLAPSPPLLMWLWSTLITEKERDCIDVPCTFHVDCVIRMCPQNGVLFPNLVVSFSLC